MTIVLIDRILFFTNSPFGRRRENLLKREKKTDKVKRKKLCQEEKMLVDEYRQESTSRQVTRLASLVMTTSKKGWTAREDKSLYLAATLC